MRMDDSRLFTERQRFTQWWVWLILGALVVLSVYALIQQLIIGEPFGEHPMPDIAMVGFSLLIFGMAVLIWVVHLDTRIDEVEIGIYFFPFLQKRISWKDVERVEIIRYGFVGYGIRAGTRHGTVYNTGGQTGLSIQLKSGRKLVIGTRRETELRIFLKQLG